MGDGYSNDYANPNTYGSIPGVSTGITGAYNRPPYYGPYRPGYIPGVSDAGAATGGPIGPTPGSPAGFNSMAQSMGLPAQQNFDAISQAIMRQQSPYVSFGGNGWLQQNHPGAAHALDNVFLTAANIPQGQTVGENIAGVAHGLIAGRQMQFQHNVEQAMLPVELAQRQFAYQKNFLDVMKDRAQIDEASQNANMNRWRAQNFERLANSSTSPYAQTKVGTDGLLYGVRKDNGTVEKVPGQTDSDMSGDPGGPPKFPVPGTTGRNPTITSLAADVANGVPGAEDKLRLAVRAEATIAGAKTGAVNDANTPKNFLASESKSVMDEVGQAPKVSTDDYYSYMGGQLASKVPYSKIPDEASWRSGIVQQYNQSKAKAQSRISAYTKSKAYERGIGLKDWEQQQQAPQAAPSAPAALPVPGTAAPQAAGPQDRLNLFGSR